MKGLRERLRPQPQVDASVGSRAVIGEPLPPKQERYFAYGWDLQNPHGFGSGPWMARGDLMAVPTEITPDSAKAGFALVNNGVVVHDYNEYGQSLTATVEREVSGRRGRRSRRRSSEEESPTYKLTLRSGNREGDLPEGARAQLELAGLTASSPEDVLRVAPLMLAIQGQPVIMHYEGWGYNYNNGIAVEDRQNPKHSKPSERE